MRPERSIVKKAIQDADGNLSQASSLLGCTRQTLYTWIYQHGLERLAGIRMDDRGGVDRRNRVDRPPSREMKTAVYSGPHAFGSLSPVEQVAMADLPVPATLKVRGSLWKQMKIEAIRRGVTVSALAEAAFEAALSSESTQRKKKAE